MPQLEISALAVRDMVALATRQLSGTSRPGENGFSIELRDYSINHMLRIELFQSRGELKGVNLRITSTLIKGNRDLMLINYLNLQHLYVTWETKGMISFCFAGDGRYTLINVLSSGHVLIHEDVDRRKEPKPKEKLSESEQLARAKRRTFYHIGPMFDYARPHDPDEPIKGSTDDIDSKNR